MARAAEGAGRGVRLDYTGCLKDRSARPGFTPEEIAARLPSRRRRRRSACGDALDAGPLRLRRRPRRLGGTRGQPARGPPPRPPGRHPGRGRHRRLGPRRPGPADRAASGAGVWSSSTTSTPRTCTRSLAGLDPERTAVNVITKSGSTAETMANLLVLLDWMEKRARARATCSAGARPRIRRRATCWRWRGGWASPPWPCRRTWAAGSRCSRPVGLVPAAFLGIDVDALLQGARAMRAHCWYAPPERNVGVVGAVLLLHLMATRRGRNIQVLMPYADALAPPRGLVPPALGGEPGQAPRPRGPGGGDGTDAGGRRWAPPTSTRRSSSTWKGPHDKVVTFLEVRAVPQAT